MSQNIEPFSRGGSNGLDLTILHKTARKIDDFPVGLHCNRVLHAREDVTRCRSRGNDTLLSSRQSNSNMLSVHTHGKTKKASSRDALVPLLTPGQFMPNDRDSPLCSKKRIGTGGIEPPTSSVSRKRSPTGLRAYVNNC